ncbi:type II toxin-antitoxin system RelE/ParE family toxin [bacterium]|nr:type II toxin-antitoxin system RelE/ParE family toxin [bacterium]
MKLKIVAAAKRDLAEGRRFYEAQERGLGSYFLASVTADIEALRISAGVHVVAHRDYHRALCRTFPFAVYYTKAGDVVIVYAVVDCRRDPAWIRQHLERTSESGSRED